MSRLCSLTSRPSPGSDYGDTIGLTISTSARPQALAQPHGRMLLAYFQSSLSTDANLQVQERQHHPPREQPRGGGQITHSKKAHRCPSPETQLTGRTCLHCACGLDTRLVCISPGCVDTARSLGLPSSAELQSWGRSHPGLGQGLSAPSLMIFVPLFGTCRSL